MQEKCTGIKGWATLTSAKLLWQGAWVRLSLACGLIPAVVRIYQQWSEEGQTTNWQQGVGPPRLIVPRGQQRLSHLVRANRSSTVAQVTQNFNDGYGRNVLQHPVHRTLLCMGLCSHRPIRVAMMTPVLRQKCLQWACKCWNLTLVETKFDRQRLHLTTFMSWRICC